MLTSLKGGYLILNFESMTISDSNEPSLWTQLKRDIYGDIRKSYGKPITLINVGDTLGDLEQEEVYYVRHIILDEVFEDSEGKNHDVIKLEVSFPNANCVHFYITPDNKAFVQEY